MNATASRDPKSNLMTICFQVQLTGSMLEDEVKLQEAANEAQSLATGECLKQFDTDGAPIVVGGIKFTAKGREPKTYQNSYGEVSVDRYVYQSSLGGRTFVPMEHDARIVRTATPLFAKQAAFKLTNNNSTTAQRDFTQHGRTIARSYLQRIGSDVAIIAQEKESSWEYQVPTPGVDGVVAGSRVTAITVSVDGTCALFCDDAYRQVMVGTIAFYDENGNRISTTYLAQSPEKGKGTFYEKMDRELRLVRERYPCASYVGIADGAHDHWEWLEKRTDWQVLDFFHASGYLSAVSAAFARGKIQRAAWVEAACHRLKHEKGAALQLLGEMERAQKSARGKVTRTALKKAISYFRNHQERMNYDFYTAMGFAIGSGVVEAACKSVVKERLCGSGMKWTRSGAQEILDLRVLVKSGNRWEEFWKKTSRYGFTRISGPKHG